MAVISDSIFVSDELLQFVLSSFEVSKKLCRNRTYFFFLKTKLGKVQKEFEKVKNSIQNHKKNVQTVFCQRQADIALKTILNWSDSSEYSQVVFHKKGSISFHFDNVVFFFFQQQLSENMFAQQKFVQLLRFLADLKNSIIAEINRKTVGPLLKAVIEALATTMANKNTEFWQNREFSHGGLHQLLLDLKFFLESTSVFSTEVSEAAIQSVMDFATIMYSKSSGKKIETLLQDDDWFSEKIQNSMGKYAQDIAKTSLIADY